MKVGILTFHNVPNFGASMQVYALKEFLVKNGCSVNVLDYCGAGNNFSIEKGKNIYRSCSKKRKAINYLRYKIFVESNYKKRYNRFLEFKSENLSIDTYDDSVSEKYDVIFYGSDQIWNPIITKGLDKVFMACDSETINIAYAASCGNVGNLEEKNVKSEFLYYLKNFKKLSVREFSLKEYIENNSKYKCDLVVDPVFLIEKDNYVSLAEKSAQKFKLPKRYLLVYELRKDSRLYKEAKYIAKQRNLKIVELCGYIDSVAHFRKKYNNCGPYDFLKLLYNAEYIITNSFHGTAFSVIFNKNFNVIIDGIGNERIEELLRLTCLENRAVKSNKSMIDISDIQYDKILNQLEKRIFESKEYIGSVMS